MIERYPLPQRHPAAGGFRLWRLRGKTDRAVRTVARSMAVHRQVYDAIPQVGRQQTRKTEPPLPPCKASGAHASWCIDGRSMDFAWDGVPWGSRIVLDGYARTRLAGAGAPPEASWVALMVRYTAWVR
jgi:hypothetical protein